MQWDDKQVWYVKRLEWKEPPGEANRLTNRLQPQGFEPFAATDKHIIFRKRINTKAGSESKRPWGESKGFDTPIPSKRDR